MGVRKRERENERKWRYDKAGTGDEDFTARIYRVCRNAAEKIAKVR